MPALPSLGKMITPADRKIYLCAGLISFISEKEQWLKRSNRNAECHNREDLSTSGDTTGLHRAEEVPPLSN